MPVVSPGSAVNVAPAGSPDRSAVSEVMASPSASAACTVTDSAPPRAATPAVDLRAAAHYSRATQPAAPMRFAPPSQTQPVALMIVGGAALLAGALIEGDAGRVFMVGGAVIGLIGLYQYLQ